MDHGKPCFRLFLAPADEYDFGTRLRHRQSHSAAEFTRASNDDRGLVF
jgi:hypothetical protein